MRLALIWAWVSKVQQGQYTSSRLHIMMIHQTLIYQARYSISVKALVPDSNPGRGSQFKSWLTHICGNAVQLELNLRPNRWFYHWDALGVVGMIFQFSPSLNRAHQVRCVWFADYYKCSLKEGSKNKNIASV